MRSSKRFCRFCGTINNKKAVFCKNCGLRIISVKRRFAIRWFKWGIIGIVLVIAAINIVKHLYSPSKKLVKIPDWYYKTENFRENWGPSAYSFILGHGNPSEGFAMPYDYKRNMFDCSEMAAYVEWALEDAGFKACICIGDAPWDPNNNTKHAWVLVKERPTLFTKGGWQPIEPTALLKKNSTLVQELKHFIKDLLGCGGYVRSYNPYYKNYFKYDHRYHSIYGIPKNCLHEFAWWNVVSKRGGKVVPKVVP